jgi:predicted acetyltransferase
MHLVLRPFESDDEDVVVTAHRALALEGVEFLWGYDAVDSWAQYLAMIADYARGENLGEGHVPGAVLAAEVDAEIVGRVSLRYALNDVLRERGGHIGYVVLAAHRRRGYATEMLRQALLLAREHGIEEVIVTCDDNNVASARVIERNGGVLESLVSDDDGSRLRRYLVGARRD